MATPRICSIPGCGKPHSSRGWCKMHHTRWLRRGSLERKGRRTGTCSVEGCDNPIRNRGWCLRHYERWRRHGTPEVGRTAAGEARRFLAEVVLKYDGSECLTWPYAKDDDGYARVGKTTVHRIACREEHGPAPSRDHLATHSCGNGHLACVARKHLSWKTAAGNSADMIAHGRSLRGTRHTQALIDEAAVREIRAMRSIISQKKIGELFGLSQGAVWRIQNRKTWAWLE